MRCAPQSAAHIFAKNSSLRGVGKLHNAQHPFLRVLWLVFVLGMTILLGYAVINLVREYFDFHTTLQFSQNINDPSDFPSITFCSHRPFADHATEVWRRGDVPSPRQFNLMLREVMRHAVESGEYQLAKDIFYCDKSSSYYQYLTPKQAESIGHNKTSFFVMCLVRHTNSTVELGHPSDCGVEIRSLSHQIYFNCFSASVKKSQSRDVTDVAFVFLLGKRPDYFGFEQSFVQNVFSQSHGLRMVLHERDYFPEIDTHGFNLPPATFNEIAYKTLKHIEQSQLRDECVDVEHMPLIRDGNDTYYYYSYAACVSQEIGKHVMEQCSCISAVHLRPQFPNITVPYCDALEPHKPESVVERRHCVQGLKLANFAANEAHQRCRKNCQVFDYETFASTTKWLPTSWQIHWMMEVSHAWDDILRGEMGSDRRQNAKSKIFNFLNTTNLTLVNPIHRYVNEHNIDEYTFVKVSRTGFGTTTKQEKLKITSSALISRIGGICSLTLGLTCAFFAELLEWLFLLLHNRYLERSETAASGNRVGKDNKTNSNHHRHERHLQTEIIPLQQCVVKNPVAV